MKLRDLLELCRISNLPTVWSNALLGAMTGLTVGMSQVESEHIDTSEQITSYTRVVVDLGWTGLLASLSIGAMFAMPLSLLYCGGMVLNDYWDRETDARERPTRPIPSGRVSSRQAMWAAIFLISAGTLILLPAQVLGLIEDTDAQLNMLPSLVALLTLVASIILYNRIHARSSLSVLLMASCRALAVLTAALFFAPFPKSIEWWIFVVAPPLSLFVYTVLISIVARREVDDAAKPLRFGGPKTVMNMIAAMPLLDAMWLVVMGLWPASLFCVACAGMTKLAHRRVAGS